MSFYISNNETPFSGTHNKVFVHDMSNGKRAVFQENYHYKELTNTAQMNHIIEDLVVNKGFLMDEQKSYVITFTHPNNTMQYNVKYTYYPKTNEIEKVETKFLSYV
jgi:hypothetical protein